jgi:hypothetical protein
MEEALLLLDPSAARIVAYLDGLDLTPVPSTLSGTRPNGEGCLPPGGDLRLAEVNALWEFSLPRHFGSRSSCEERGSEPAGLCRTEHGLKPSEGLRLWDAVCA